VIFFISVNWHVAQSMRLALENEYFTNYRESFTIREYNGFSMDQLDELAGDLALHIGGQHATRIMEIRFTANLECIVFDFFSDQNPKTGTTNFGVVAVVRNGDTVKAVACVYVLDFTLGKDIITTTATTRWFMLFTTTRENTIEEYRDTSYFTKDKLRSFCLSKAYGEFKRKGIC